MSLIKRLEEKNIEKKQIRQEKEIDPYVELKAKIQNKVIDELELILRIYQRKTKR